jgi:hypothetical protein
MLLKNSMKDKTTKVVHLLDHNLIDVHSSKKLNKSMNGANKVFFHLFHQQQVNKPF